MRVSVLLNYEPRSTLPLGGTPADDRTYLVWRGRFLESTMERDLVTRWHDAFNFPLNISAHGLDAHLFVAMGGANPMFGKQDTPIYMHRLRFLGITFRDHRRGVIRTAMEYVERAKNYA